MKIDINKVINTVRRHCKNQGLCLPHSVVACKTLERLGESATVMMIGNFQHFYIKTKNFGDIDVFPNYKGELNGEYLNLDMLRMTCNSEHLRLLTDDVVTELQIIEKGGLSL